MKHQLPAGYLLLSFPIFLFLILITPVYDSTARGQKAVHPDELVPGEFRGWKAQGEVEVYDRETIFDYIDGAGEVYRLYSFRKVVVRRLVKVDQPTIFVEIFDMGSSADAFGVFSHSREGEDLGIGEGSEQRGGLLCFWKGSFFVCIYSERETAETEETVPALAKGIAQRIKGEGGRPGLLEYLPPDGLQRLSIRYFHLYGSLNYHYYLADQNILKLSEQTEAVFARYQPGRTYLLLIQYQSSEEAAEALASFVSLYIPEAKESGIAEVQEGRWVKAILEGVFVAVVFDAPTAASAEALMGAVRAKLGRSNSKGKKG